MNYVSATEAAGLWGVSPRSVRNYCAQGRVPGAVLIGKTWNIPAGTLKPVRLNARMSAQSMLHESPLLDRLRKERASHMPGGIYHRVQIELTYNSNHIEGSRLTHDQTRLIFETSTIGSDGDGIRVDDVIETVNHFRCIDHVIDTADEAVSEALLKNLHRILKSSTSDSDKEWFAVGDYKRLPNEVGGRDTVPPGEVARAIDDLVGCYEASPRHTIDDIVGFHVAFERIHPFQDGNGRIGRLLMFKECLRNNVVPFVITDETKLFYYRGLSRWDEERGWLMDTCLSAQDTFKGWLDYFEVPYCAE